MESKLKDNKTKSQPSFMEGMMLHGGIIMMFSSGVYVTQNFGAEEADIWAWFSRFALAIVCFGFAGVMRAIRKAND